MTRHVVRKKPANVSVNAALLTEAKLLKINLSQTLEDRLKELIAEKRRARWLEDNGDALEAYNRRVSSRGLFGDKARTF